jgi:hypothetical protein
LLEYFTISFVIIIITDNGINQLMESKFSRLNSPKVTLSCFTKVEPHLLIVTI